MSGRRQITRADIMPMEEYAKIRKERRAATIAIKRLRQVPVGPFAIFHFETYETMWAQVHEMLYIERGGEEQIAEELHAYNPLIPQGQELTATMMLEIEDPIQRAKTLLTLGGIETSITFSFAGEKVYAQAESDVERTKADGKTSAVHFLHFPFTPAQMTKFIASETQVILGFAHPHYGHMAALSPETKAALAKDFVF